MLRVNFRKDFWDCRRVREKIWPIADQRVPRDDPRNTCGTYPVLTSSLKWRMRDEKENHFNKGASATYDLALFSDRTSATLRKCLITSLNL